MRTGSAVPMNYHACPAFLKSPTNGFFNHRANSDSTRDTWMMTLGSAVGKPEIVERPIRHVDLCPTLAGLLGCRPSDAQGERLKEFLT